MKYLFFIFGIITLFSCKKDNPSTIQSPSSPPSITDSNELKPVWQTSSEIPRLVANIDPVIFGDKVIYSWTSTDIENYPHSLLVAYDKATGQKIWEWSDFLEEVEYFGGWDLVYQYQDYLVLATSGYNTYCINLNTGQTHWSKSFETGVMSISGIEGLAFYVEYLDYTKKCRIHRLDVETENTEVLLEYTTVDTYQPVFSTPTPFVNSDGEIILIFNDGTYSPEEQNTRNYLTFYNLTRDSIEYHESLENSAVNDRVIINEGKVYIGGENTFCFDIETYEKIWESSIPENSAVISGWSGILFSGDKMFIGTGGSMPILYCLNKNTGDVIWQKTGYNTPSYLRLYSDHIYLTNSGLLQVVDIHTGETLVRLVSPDYQQNDNAFFSDGISIDPETGRIYTGNYISALCYEPYGH